MATPEQWLARLAKLKVDRASGDPAPHKPLLLLVVLELAEQGLLPHQELPLTPELAFRFNTYWSMVLAAQATARYSLSLFSSEIEWFLVATGAGRQASHGSA
jgi:predicted restriction endonuclease